MQYRMFGSTGLRVSAIGFGAWAIGGPAMAGNVPIGWGDTNDDSSLSALRQAFEQGITFYDTADFYGLGHSEELIGSVFGNSDRVVIATKVGHRLNPEGTIALDYSKKHILQACEQSLHRLRRDAIDLYQLHSARLIHLEQGECIGAMEQLRQEGKVRHWGLSLNTFAPAEEARWLMRMGLGQGFQTVLNILNQRARGVIDEACKAGYGIIARMPLQFGLLTGKITPEQTFPPTDHRSFRLTPEIIRSAREGLEQLEPIRRKLGISGTAFALSYCASIKGVSTVIPGIRTAAQAKENTADIVQLTSEDLRSIEELDATIFGTITRRLQEQG